MNTWTVKVRWRFEGYINTTHSCPVYETRGTVKVRWRFQVTATQSCSSMNTWTAKVRWRFQVTTTQSCSSMNMWVVKVL